MYVYFIQEGRGSHGNIKIGKANNVDKRLNSLQTGNPRKLTIMASIKCKCVLDALKLEKRLHNKFKANRVRGEWFDSKIRLSSIQEEFNIEPDKHKKNEDLSLQKGIKLDKDTLKKYHKAKKLIWEKMGGTKQSKKDIIDFLWRSMRIEVHSLSGLRLSVIDYCESNGLMRK